MEYISAETDTLLYVDFPHLLTPAIFTILPLHRSTCRIYPPPLLVKGSYLRERFFSSSRRARSEMDGGRAGARARALLSTVRLDGGMHVLHSHAAVKTNRESEQTRELQAFLQPPS